MISFVEYLFGYFIFTVVNRKFGPFDGFFILGQIFFWLFRIILPFDISLSLLGAYEYLSVKSSTLLIQIFSFVKLITKLKRP